MAIRRRKPKPKPKPKKKPAKKKGVNPGGPNIPVPPKKSGGGTSSGSSTSATPASSVVASEDMSSSPVYGSAADTGGQSSLADTGADDDSVLGTGSGYAPHYHTAVPYAEQVAATSAQENVTTEVSPI